MLTAKDDVSVPVCVSGLVQKIEVDFCMDGAGYRVSSTLGDYRVKARNAEVGAALEKIAGTRTAIGVCGDVHWGPECGYLDAYWAGPPERLKEIA